MHRILVTGGAGFIGSHLVDRLLSEGHEVVACDNLSSGRMENLKTAMANPRFSFKQLDLRDTDALIPAMRGCRSVFHIAAHADVRSGASDTRIDMENGAIATCNVLEAMRLNNIKEIIYASSASVYGETPPVPMKEDHGPLQPISLYGASKLASEAFISAYCHTFDMRGWMFRFANIVGARRRQGVVYDFVHRLKQNPAELEILGNGSQCKPYLHVGECVDGILFGYRNAGDRVNLFNIGVDSATDVRTIAAIVTAEMELSEARLKFGESDRGWAGDAPQLRFDMSKMQKLGWRARLSSDEAVRLAATEHIAELSTCR
jgi:UDP-glucose 4-epimerase